MRLTNEREYYSRKSREQSALAAAYCFATAIFIVAVAAAIQAADWLGGWIYVLPAGVSFLSFFVIMRWRKKKKRNKKRRKRRRSSIYFMKRF